MRDYRHAAGWTDERMVRLTELVATGHSAGQIARLLAGGVTRNAVIGKITRLGLRLGHAAPPREIRRTLSREDRSLQNRINGKRFHAAKPKAEPPAPKLKPTPALRLVVEAPTAHARRLTDLAFSQCRWPLDMSLNEATVETLFCAAPVGCEEGSFCPVHRARAYVKPTPVGAGYFKSLRRYVA